MNYLLQRNFQRAIEYFKPDSVDENDPHIQKYQEQLYTCYLMRADMIDFDFWTRYIELLDDPTIDFDEYTELDSRFDGSIEEVTAEDTETIARLKEILSDLRKYEGNDVKELVLIKSKEDESPEIADDYEIKKKCTKYV